MGKELALTLYVIFAVFMPELMLILNVFLAPRRRNSRFQRIGFESGQRPIRWFRSAFPVEYFPYAIIYLAYAVVGLVAFLSALAVSRSPELMDRVLVFLGALSVGAVFLGWSLRRLPQSLWRGGG